MSAYESIKQGLNEALALAGEHASHALVRQVKVQGADVALIREGQACRKLRLRAVSASPNELC